MKKLALMFSMLMMITSVSNGQGNIPFSALNDEYVETEIEAFEIEQELFENYDDVTININDIKVIEVEEEIEINFDTKKYLPKRFNAYKGMYDVNWDEIELIELEEEVELGFDTKKYLPRGFIALKVNEIKTESIVVSL